MLDCMIHNMVYFVFLHSQRQIVYYFNSCILIALKIHPVPVVDCCRTFTQSITDELKKEYNISI
jgi:hypothetical protein